MNAACKVCGEPSQPFGEALVLGKHGVRFFRCASCGFVQTEEPFWLEEAYQDALSGLDVGAASRNLRLAPITRAVIHCFFSSAGRFLDYGGGTGLFVRLMRDSGFDFHWMDKFARNIFARGFEGSAGTFELLTAFEVIEHLVEPATELEKMVSFSRNLLFTTVLLPDPAPQPGHWWYYGLEHGQHVAFHTKRSLAALGQRFGLKLCSAGELHLLTNQPVPPARFRLATRRRVVQWVNWWSRRPSLTESDFRRLAGSQAQSGTSDSSKATQAR